MISSTHILIDLIPVVDFLYQSRPLAPLKTLLDPEPNRPLLALCKMLLDPELSRPPGGSLQDAIRPGDQSPAGPSLDGTSEWLYPSQACRDQ
jgi:hypothetical protein